MMNRGPVPINAETLRNESPQPEWTVLQRFTGRLFRRDVALAFERIPLELEDHGQLLIYGSTSIQMHSDRPARGYPYPRRPRDIDLAIINCDGPIHYDEQRPTPVMSDSLINYLRQAVESVGGSVLDVNTSMSNCAGAMAIEKTYPAEEILRRVKGKNESGAILIAEPTTVELAISIFTPRTPILPVVSRGNIFHEDVREVVAYKLARLVSDSHIELKDIADLFNVFATGVVDFKQDARLIRLLSLVRIASYSKLSAHNYNDYLQSRSTQEDNWQALWHKLSAPFAWRSANSHSGITADNGFSWQKFSSCRLDSKNIELVRHRLHVGEKESIEILSDANQILNLVFPNNTGLPLRAEYGGLPLSDGEYSFLNAVDGFNMGRQRHHNGMHIDPSLLLQDYPEFTSRHAELANAIQSNFHLRRKLELVQKWQGM